MENFNPDAYIKTLGASEFNPDEYLKSQGVEIPEQKPFQPQPQETPEDTSSFNPDQYIKKLKYGTLGQQAIAGAEAVGRGVAGPLSTGAERLLGVNPEDIRGREEVNPGTSMLGETAGFAGSAGLGFGLGKLATGVGEGVAKLAPKILPKLAVTGVRTGAEMAALQTSDELSKMITEDPGQSVGSAITNIGLSAALGGVGGAALGAVSPLWKAGTEKLGLSKLIDDYKGQYNFRQTNPEPGAAAVDELSGRMSEMEELKNNSTSLKGKAIAESLPENTPNNIQKIDFQIQEISDKVASRLEKAAESIKTRSAVPYLAEDFTKFQESLTNPNTSSADKFNALDQLKKDFASYAKYRGTEEATAKGALGAELSSVIRPALEDTKVWGDAGRVQAKINAAITDSIKAQKDMVSKFTSKQMGELAADPNKVATYLKQANGTKAQLKQSVLNNYLEHTQKLADTIKEIHESAGLEAPASTSLNSTPVLNHSLQKTSAGTDLANWAYDKGASSSIGHGVAGAVGAKAGSLVGHPELGAIVGAKLLGPTFSAIAKPLVEGITHSPAAKATINFVSQVAKGQKLQESTIKNVLKGSSIVLPNHLIPKQHDRDKLLDKFAKIDENPDSALDVGQNLQHYMPDHATSIASTLATAKDYLDTIRPKQTLTGPLEEPLPVSKSAQTTYNRQVDIVQQPLMVLEHVKTGTLTEQDMKTLLMVYPRLAVGLIGSVNKQIVESKVEGVSIPYKLKQSLSLLIGSPLDTTFTQPSMQTAIASNTPKQQEPQSKAKKPSKPSNAQNQKSAEMFATETQARETDKRG